MLSNQVHLEELVRLSRIIGESACFVQGGGGNISVKTNSQNMLIKASGWLLKDVTITSGFSVVNYFAIRELLLNEAISEADFNSSVNTNAKQFNGNRPSIETSFHAVLPNYTIHTHSVFANILSCSQEGKALSQQLFPASFWVEYATPGLTLTRKLMQAIPHLEAQGQFIVFLENHGVIVSANTAEAALKLHEQVNYEICRHFGIVNQNLDLATFYEKSFDPQEILFPDQAVYALNNNELSETQAAKETLSAYQFILRTIKGLNLTPQFINSQEVTILLNLESEKHRQKLAKK